MIVLSWINLVANVVAVLVLGLALRDPEHKWWGPLARLAPRKSR